jgi:DNA polymerase III delta subunit
MASAAKPVYALVGSDPFLQLEKLREILRLMPRDVQRVEVEGERAELAEVLDELRSFAMFGGAKLVVVRDADEFLGRYREQLEGYCARPSDSGTLVLRLASLPKNQRIYKAIDKLGGVEPCDPPKDLATWSADRARSAHKITLAPEAARLLADLVGEDLGRIDNELAKLAIEHDGAKTPVRPEQVASSVAFQREQEMWDMTNELAAGEASAALRRWRQLVQLDTSAEFRAVTWLGMWLENVRKALALKRKGLGSFAICQQLRIWPREMQDPFLKTACQLGDRGAAAALDLLAEIDHQSKTGVGDAATNVERFILQVGAGIGTSTGASTR